MAVIAAETAGGQWVLRSGQNSAHNHAPVDSVVFHKHRHRQLEDSDVRRQIKVDYDVGTAPRNTLARLHQQNFWHITIRDVYNEQQRLRRLDLNGKTPIERAIEVCEERENFWSRWSVDDEFHCNLLFMAHRKMIKLYRRHPDVLLLDCTYKTNRFNLPLLNICGVTRNNENIPLALVFIENEKADGAMSWALGCLKSLFSEEGIPMPRVVCHDRQQSLINALEADDDWKAIDHVLCRWHMNKCVLAWLQDSRHYFGGTYRIEGVRHNDPQVDDAYSVYRELITSKTEADFYSNWRAIERRGEREGRWSAFADYLNNQWLVYKDLCVNAWTDRVAHYGNLTTSRLEGCHAELKRWLRNSRCDILTFVRRLEPWWSNVSYRHRTITAELLVSVTPYSANNPLTAGVVKTITPFALWRVEKQVELAKASLNEPDTTCSLAYQHTWGLPCRHALRVHLETGLPLATS
jgi:hypothetical protein